MENEDYMRPDADAIRQAAAEWLRESGDMPVSFNSPDMVLVKGGTFEMGDVMGDKEDDRRNRTPRQPQRFLHRPVRRDL
jgi:formylglycine-generating enzyme required for sulfatase activity